MGFSKASICRDGDVSVRPMASNIVLSSRLLNVIPWYYTELSIDIFGRGTDNMEAIVFDLGPRQAIQLVSCRASLSTKDNGPMIWRGGGQDQR